MERDDKKRIEDIKIALIYGAKKVDNVDKEGLLEEIYRDDDDTAHFYYMRDFLKHNFLNENSIQESISNSNVNSIFFEIQKLGHIVFAENTSVPDYKSGLIYLK